MSDENQNSGMSDATFKRLKGLLSEPDSEDIGVGSEPPDSNGTDAYVRSKKITPFFRGTKDELIDSLDSLRPHELQAIYFDELKNVFGKEISRVTIDGENAFLISHGGQKDMLSSNIFFAVENLKKSGIQAQIAGEDVKTKFLEADGAIIIQPDVLGLAYLYERNHPDRILTSEEYKSFKPAKHSSHRFKAVLEKMTGVEWSANKLNEVLVDQAFSDADFPNTPTINPPEASDERQYSPVYQPEYKTLMRFEKAKDLAAGLSKLIAPKDAVITSDESGHIIVHFCNDNLKPPTSEQLTTMKSEFARNQIRQL